MKNKVLAFLKDLPKTPVEQFNKAFELFRKSSGANARMINSFNSQGFSQTRLESVLHELKKLHGISERDIILFEPETIVEVQIDDNQDVNTAAKTFTLDVAPVTYLYSDESGNALEETPSLTSAEQAFQLAPVEVKTEIKLREEFPFLNDPACPDKILILVGKKLIHYNAYVNAHKALMATLGEFDGEGKEIVAPVELTAEETFKIAAAAVENFVANQDIYDELNHYKLTGEILGKHQIFADEAFRSKLDGQTVVQVSTRKSNLLNYINRGELALPNLKDKKKTDMDAKLVTWARELELVKEWLDKHDTKK